MNRKLFLSMLLAGCMAVIMPAAVYAESEVTAEEATEKSTEKVEKKKKSAKGLSDDLYSFSVKVGDVAYQFPMTYAEFMEKGGWEVSKYYQDQEEDPLTPNSYTFFGVEKEKNEMTAYLINYDINEVAMADCYVGGVEINGEHYFDAENVEVLMPGGIKVGVSTMKDIQAAYGTPSDTYEGDSYTKVTYKKDSYSYVDLYVYKDSNVLKNVEIRNFEEPEGFVHGEVSKEVPEVVTNYKKPKALTDDFTDPIVEYFGNLYRLPAPVSAFTANGWKIENESEDDYVVGDGFAAINMSKDNQSVRFYLYNYSHNATTYENCLVRELGFYTYDNAAINMKLSGGVVLGANADELMAAAKENEYYVDDKMEDGYLTIAKNDDVKYSNNVEFWINTEEDAVAVAGFSITCRDIEE